MATTVPPVKLDNFVGILINAVCNERKTSINVLNDSIYNQATQMNLKKAGVRDIINLGILTGIFKRKTGVLSLTEDGYFLFDILQQGGKGRRFWSELHRCFQRIEVYRNFINFLRVPKKDREARDFLGKRTTAKTMLRWLKVMGILNEYDTDKSVQYVPFVSIENIDIWGFVQAIKVYYAEKAIEAGPMWRGTFTDIEKLREKMCKEFIIDYNTFDELLKEIITDSKFEINARLAKGPSTAYSIAGKSAFEYNGDKYLYIALREGQDG